MKITQEGHGHRNGQSAFGDIMGRESRAERGGKGRRSSRGQNQMMRQQSESSDRPRDNAHKPSNAGQKIAFSPADQRKIAQKFNASQERIDTILSNNPLQTQNAKPLTGRFAPSSAPKGTQSSEQAFENIKPRSSIERLLDNAFSRSRF